ncbi:MAG: glycosyl hydrolase 115 family protein [Clostridia bacterium]|nr:glycosyl hydrolase 115 family protein [Clostridia bacterium]
MLKNIILTHAPEAVLLAARDLQRDLRRLTGEEFPILSEGEGIEITILPGEPESYTVVVERDRVTVTGGDALGAVFGIYAFERRCLGILPVHRLIDRFPAPGGLKLTPQVFASPKRKTRFRGWFLNDEDLLTDFEISGGKRHIDYHFYENVMDESVLDMILETALRLEINLVIPSSFIDVDNPAEEKLIAAAVRRGLYVSQHHLEPLGVSWFTAENYMKAHGLNEEISVLSNRSRMEEIWRYYAKKWAKYGDRVVWQLGLRGKGDRAVWQNDPSIPLDNAARGGIITEAIATQHRILCETLGTADFYSTSTFWMEGAALYAEGHLKLPQGTIAVFSDIGFSQMFGGDFHTTPRRADARYGIYYHVGFFVEGPHLAEGCDLLKLRDSYAMAQEKDSLYYCILNVSNVRPLHFSAWYAAEWLGTGGEWRVEDQLQALFGETEITLPLLQEYYAAIADMGRDNLIKRCKDCLFQYHSYEDLPYPHFPVTDGVLMRLGRNYLKGNIDERYCTRPTRQLEESLGKWEALYQKMQAAEEQLPAESRLYFRQFLKFETFYMMQMTRWVLACSAHQKEEATQALRSILQERKILEQGSWENWHRGDVKIGITKLLQITEEKL